MRFLVVLSGKRKQFDVEVRWQPIAKDTTASAPSMHAGGSTNTERAAPFPIGFQFHSTEAKEP